MAAGDRVAFLDRNGIEYFEVFFGCALLGAVSVAVNWRLAPAEMAAIIEDAGAPVLFFGADYAAAVKEFGPSVDRRPPVGPPRPVRRVAGRRCRPPRPHDPGFEPGPDDVVTQLYTSGTTGLPKGAMISGRNISCILDRGRPGLPHRRRHGLAGGHAALPHRRDRLGPVRHVPRRPLGHRPGHGPGRGAAAHRGARITETFVVPAVLMFLLATPELATTDVSSLRTVFYGASPISEDVLVRSMNALGCDFAQVYGLTETTGAITSLMPEDHDPDGPRARTAAVGRPALRPRRAADRRHRYRARSCRRRGRARCGPVRTRTCSATGTSPTRPPPSSPTTAGSEPGTPDGSTPRATSSSTTASRT